MANTGHTATRRRRTGARDPAVTGRKGVPAARLPRTLFAALALLAAGVPVYVAMPMPAELHQAFYQVIATGALVVAGLGLRRHRPVRRRGWLLVLLGYSGWVAGDLVWT